MDFFLLDHQNPGKYQNLSQKINHKKSLRRRLIERDGRTCSWCGQGNLSDLTMDHVVPDSLGGPMTSYNLIPSCRSCNSARGNRSALFWYEQCLKKGYKPDAEIVVSSLRQCLLYGSVDSRYSLYYVSLQLQSSVFSEILREIGGPFSQGWENSSQTELQSSDLEYLLNKAKKLKK